MFVRLSHADKETIVAEVRAKKATMTELAERYGVAHATISSVFKKMTGTSLQPRLSQSDRNTIVAELLTGKATVGERSAKYRVKKITIANTFKP